MKPFLLALALVGALSARANALPNAPDVIPAQGGAIYIAGDTQTTPEMKALKNIDIAFLPMNLPYTMTPQEAAAGARACKPKMVFPYHYRFPFDKANDNLQQFAKALAGSGIQVKLRGWYDHPATKLN